jgi:hypothetical protein
VVHAPESRRRAGLADRGAQAAENIAAAGGTEGSASKSTSSTASFACACGSGRRDHAVIRE